MSKSDTRSDIELTEKLRLHRCSCGRCCNAKKFEILVKTIKLALVSCSRNKDFLLKEALKEIDETTNS